MELDKHLSAGSNTSQSTPYKAVARTRLDTLENIICVFLRLTLVPFFLREIVQKRKVTIILYHDPDPATLNLHLKVLKSKYNIISLKEYMKSRKTGNTGKLPPKSLIITLDDGHRANYRLLPVFMEHGVMPTIFVCSGIVGTNRHFWWTEVKGSYDINSLKKLPDVERVKILGETGFTEERVYDERQALSAQEIDDMAENVDFQSHSVYHRCLSRCDMERARDEINNSKRELKEKFGVDAFALSYPNGDYSAEVVELAKDAGYECGLTVDRGFNDWKTDVYRLKRIGLRDRGSASEVTVRVTGLWDFLKKFARPYLKL